MQTHDGAAALAHSQDVLRTSSSTSPRQLSVVPKPYMKIPGLRGREAVYLRVVLILAAASMLLYSGGGRGEGGYLRVISQTEGLIAKVPCSTAKVPDKPQGMKAPGSQKSKKIT
jgi:hypothetical protein